MKKAFERKNSKESDKNLFELFSLIALGILVYISAPGVVRAVYEIGKETGAALAKLF